MGSGKGVVDGTALLVSGLAYVAYVLVGFAMFAVGVVYYTEIKDANQSIMIIVAASGFGMVAVGGLALYSLKEQKTMLLRLVVLLDVALFTFVLGAAVVGLMLGLDVRDPIREATTRAWGDFSSPSAHQRESRLVIWDGQVCSRNLVSVCEDHFAAAALDAIGSPHSNYTAGQQRVRDLFADCEYARQGLKCVTKEDDETECAAQNLNGSPDADLQECEGYVGNTFNGCQYVPAVGDTAESCVPKPDCAAGDALKGFCETCNQECREYKIDLAKSNLLPAAHLVYGIFAFCMICVLINDHLTSPDGMDGVWTKLGMFFHGLVSLTGLGLAIAAMVGQYYMSEECPGEDIATCTNPAIWFVCGLGLALLVVGAIGVYAVKSGVGGATGFIALAPLNLVLLGIALPLLVCGIFLSISTGSVDTVHTTFDKHYPELRKSVEAQNEDYCTIVGDDGGVTPMSDADCRAKMTAALEDQILLVGAIACGTALGIFAVTLLTKHVVTAWSRGDDDEESSTMMKNPLDEE